MVLEFVAAIAEKWRRVFRLQDSRHSPVNFVTLLQTKLPAEARGVQLVTRRTLWYTAYEN